MKIPTLEDILNKEPLFTIHSEEIEKISLKMQEKYIGGSYEGNKAE